MELIAVANDLDFGGKGGSVGAEANCEAVAIHGGEAAVDVLGGCGILAMVGVFWFCIMLFDVGYSIAAQRCRTNSLRTEEQNEVIVDCEGTTISSNRLSASEPLPSSIALAQGLIPCYLARVQKVWHLLPCQQLQHL